MEEANIPFENQWQAAFDGAEMTPSEHVWTSIDGVLANQEAGVFKKRIVFFKWVAAASIMIMLTAVAALWMRDYNEDTFMSESTNSSDDLHNNFNSLVYIPENDCPDENDGNSGMNIAFLATDESCEEIETEAVMFADILKDTELKTSILVLEEENSSTLESLKEKNHNSNNLAFNKLTPKKLVPFSNESMSPIGELYGVANTFAIDLVDEKNDFNLWAGLSVSAGNFNPNADKNTNIENLADAVFSVDNSSSNQSLSLQQINNESLSSGTSVSIGFDLRAKASSKIVLSSGIHYLRNNSSLNSNLIVSDANTGDTFALTSDEAGSESFKNTLENGNFSTLNSNSSFRNEFQYISIPLKAGYILLNKKINVILNSGLSTNILVGANQQNSDGQTQLFDGGESFQNDYNTVYFNLLSSVEFGYTFQSNYFFSIEPTYSQALTDFTKSENNFSSKPKNIGLSIGLKYNF